MFRLSSVLDRIFGLIL